MSWKLYPMTSILVTVCSAAHAQHHPGQPPHHNAVPQHPGAVHPGHPQQGHSTSPEQHMWNQWYQEQMMMNAMMGGTRSRRAHPQGSSGRGIPSQHQAAGKTGSANHEAATNGANHPAAAKKAAHKESHATRKLEPRTTKKTAQSQSASDQSVISLLRTTHTRLANADHDYDGHRARAMTHIASAVGDLGSSTPLNSFSQASAGNLAQSESDRVLRDAIVQLRHSETSLSNGSNRAERHHRARGAVGLAIHELETALRIR